jgi:hypothetical protein
MQTWKDWWEPTGIKFNVNNWDQKQLLSTSVPFDSALLL